jgi:hypothetical protein
MLESSIASSDKDCYLSKVNICVWDGTFTLLWYCFCWCVCVLCGIDVVVGRSMGSVKGGTELVRKGNCRGESILCFYKWYDAVLEYITSWNIQINNMGMYVFWFAIFSMLDRNDAIICDVSMFMFYMLISSEMLENNDVVRECLLF